MDSSQGIKVGLRDYFSIFSTLLVSYFKWSGALQSPDLLLIPYNITNITHNHHTNIPFFSTPKTAMAHLRTFSMAILLNEMFIYVLKWYHPTLCLRDPRGANMGGRLGAWI
jgi:hypothetical protein